jgi:hypothetical protein
VYPANRPEARRPRTTLVATAVLLAVVVAILLFVLW